MDFRGVWEDEYGIPLENFIKQRGSLIPWHFDPLLAFHDHPVIQNHFPGKTREEDTLLWGWIVESPLFIHALFWSKVKTSYESLTEAVDRLKRWWMNNGKEV